MGLQVSPRGLVSLSSARSLSLLVILTTRKLILSNWLHLLDGSYLALGRGYSSFGVNDCGYTVGTWSVYRS